MRFKECSSITDTEKQQLYELWNNEYPKQLSYNNISELDNYLNDLESHEHTILLDQESRIKGWCFKFDRDNARWFAIIIDRSLFGKGFGSKLLHHAKQNENELNGWVIDSHEEETINGYKYRSPLNFYLKNGFHILENNRFEKDKISAVQVQWKK